MLLGSRLQKPETSIDCTKSYWTHHVSSFGILLNVRHCFLLLLLELAAFSLQFALSLLQRSLVLSEALSRGQATPKEGILQCGRGSARERQQKAMERACQ